ncbi:MAG: S8 family peptidase [Methanotrichaceae archaeon]|nr:S8 family peptidase [Methanotrichaceae archaeon]
MIRRSLWTLFVVLILIFLLPAVSASARQDGMPDHLPAGNMSDDGKLPVVVLFKGLDRPDLSGVDVRYQYRLINGLAGRAASSDIERIAGSETVLGVYPDDLIDVKMPADETSNGLLLCPATVIGAEKLWERGIDGSGVVVAVLDSGIDRNHPDLAGKVIGEKNFVEDEASADDLLGHGTMVAGIIAGSGAMSSGTYKGVAPGAGLLNVKVIDKSGDGKVSDIIAGIEWALYSGADVLSLSLGGANLGETNPPITMAADNAMDAGAVVCVAAGNRNNTKTNGVAQSAGPNFGLSGEDMVRISQRSDSDDVFLVLVPIILALTPGLIDSPGDGVNVITVGSSDCAGHVAGFSGSGPTRDGRTKPEIVGPGVDVVSTVPMALEDLNYIDVYYARESGTSLSTPAVAGMAALLLQAEPDLTPAGVKAALTRGAEKLRNSQGEEYEEYYQGAGEMNAEGSYQQLDQDLCAAIPDKWVAGKWAYLPAGKGLYVGLDAGADRPQKKLYSLAPGDEDWNNEFVFFTDKDREDLQVSAEGEVADWISLQSLPRKASANDQEIFGASLRVPEDALPGTHNGSIIISEKGRSIFTIPVSVEVAEPLAISRGRGSATDMLADSQWHYYYLDVPVGTSELRSVLSAKGTSASLDLFLLSPTSEYYAGELKGLTQEVSVESPPNGRWLLAVHSENLTAPLNYSLEVERSLIDSSPRRWNLEDGFPGQSVSSLFVVENRGPALENLSYRSVIENITRLDLSGSVGSKEVWESTLAVTDQTSRLSARLHSHDRNNRSELLFLFEDPEGQPLDADLGKGDLGPLEVSRPKPGLWKIRVYGYDVPGGGQSFDVGLTDYAKEPWSWILTEGPGMIESESNGTIKAVLSIPENASSQRLDGYLEVSAANQSFQIPVSVTVAGTTLEGLREAKALDSNGDGYYDRLRLDLGLNETVSGVYSVEGVLTDCAGNRIEDLSATAGGQMEGQVEIEVNGSLIWRWGRCGPLRIENLVLRNPRGDLIDHYEGKITIDEDPKSFQPPSAFFSGGFQNLTGSQKIAIGVNLTVIDPGTYRVEGSLLNDRGEEVGKDSVEKRLVSGNVSLSLEFNPTKFEMFGRSSRLHLVDLVLSRDGAELDRLPEAWSSGVMNPRGFGPAASSSVTSNLTPEGGRGAIRIENGRAVIS